MKKVFVFTIGLIFPFLSLYSQTFYDKEFDKVDDKQDAYYYMIIDSSQDLICEKTFLMNDTINVIAHFKKDLKKKLRIREGKTYEYYESGKLKYDLDYTNNQLNGTVKGYFESGNVKRIDHYEKDNLLDGKCYLENGQDTAYYVFQKCASYHGQDLNEFRRFVSQNLVYPEMAAIEGIAGKVYVQFSIDPEGNLTVLRVLKSPDVLLSKAAVEAIQKSDRWEPSIRDGKKVKQKFVIPVEFKLR